MFNTNKCEEITSIKLQNINNRLSNIGMKNVNILSGYKI